MLYLFKFFIMAQALQQTSLAYKVLGRCLSGKWVIVEIPDNFLSLRKMYAQNVYTVSSTQEKKRLQDTRVWTLKNKKDIESFLASC